MIMIAVAHKITNSPGESRANEIFVEAFSTATSTLPWAWRRNKPKPINNIDIATKMAVESKSIFRSAEKATMFSGDMIFDMDCPLIANGDIEEK